MYLDDPVCNKEEILELVSMAEDGDEIYYMDEFFGCFRGDHFGFKLTRDGKTIMKTEIFKKQKPLPIQNKTAISRCFDKINALKIRALKYIF